MYILVPLVFQISTTICTILFLKLASQWPRLLNKFIETDQKLGIVYERVLGLRMALLSGCVLIPALGKNIFSFNFFELLYLFKEYLNRN